MLLFMVEQVFLPTGRFMAAAKLRHTVYSEGARGGQTGRGLLNLCILPQNVNFIFTLSDDSMLS